MTSDFPTTSWSLICSLRDGDPKAARSALAVLCQVYWPPLYAFARRQGMDAEAARDITQAFFLHLLERDTLAKADASKSRFRAFLLGAFRNFMGHERERASAKKRAPERSLVSLDGEEAEKLYRREPADYLTPEEIYERRWAQIVAGRAMKRLELEQRRSGNQDRFQTLRGYVLGDDSTPPYREVGEALGMSVSAVKVAVHRLRREFGKWLRAEVTPTLADLNDTDDEVRHILQLIERSHGGLDGAGL